MSGVRTNGFDPIPSELRGTLAADRLDYIAERVDVCITLAHDGHLSAALDEVTAVRRRLQRVEQLIKTGKQ